MWLRQAEKPPALVVFDDDVAIIGSSDERLRGERETEEVDDEADDGPALNMAGSPAPSTGGTAAEGEVEGGDRFVDVDAHEEGEESFASLLGVQLEDFSVISWTDIGKFVEVELEAFTGKPGVDAGTFEVNLSVANRKVYDYRDFLKRFSSL